MDFVLPFLLNVMDYHLADKYQFTLYLYLYVRVQAISFIALYNIIRVNINGESIGSYVMYSMSTKTPIAANMRVEVKQFAIKYKKKLLV